MIEKYNPSQVEITFSDAALRHIYGNLAKQVDAKGFYLGTEKAGCSGYAYVADILKEVDADVVLAKTNADFDVYVEQQSVAQLNGLTVDVEQKTLGQRMLTYINPNEAARCGCGESFMPKNQTK